MSLNVPPECGTLRRRQVRAQEVYTRELKDCSGAEFVHFFVEGATGPDGPATSGPFPLENRDTLRMWSPAGVNVAQGVTVEMPFTRCGKLWLVENIKSDFESLEVFLPSDLEVAFSEGLTLLQGGHTYTNTTDKCVKVEVHAQIACIIDSNDTTSLLLLQNEKVVAYSVQTPNDLDLHHVTLTCVVLCQPGDTLDLGLLSENTGAVTLPSYVDPSNGLFFTLTDGITVNVISYIIFKESSVSQSLNCQETLPTRTDPF